MASLVAEKDVAAIAAAVDLGIFRGKQLLNWWTASRPDLVQFNAGLTHDGTSQCFFTTMELEGKPSSMVVKKHCDVPSCVRPALNWTRSGREAVHQFSNCLPRKIPRSTAAAIAATSFSATRDAMRQLC